MAEQAWKTSEVTVHETKAAALDVAADHLDAVEELMDTHEEIQQLRDMRHTLLVARDKHLLEASNLSKKLETAAQKELEALRTESKKQPVPA